MTAKRFDLEVAVRMLDAGETVARIAEVLKVRDYTVRENLKKANVRYPDARLNTQFDVDAIRKEWNAGVLAADIVARHKISGSSLYRLTRGPGFVERVDGRLAATDDDIIALRETGLSQAKIAAELCVSENLVGRRLRKLEAAKALPAQKPRPAPAPAPEPKGALDPVSIKILRSGGRWAALSQIAAEHDLTHAQAQARWHRLRAG
jgi:hypothetical protein